MVTGVYLVAEQRQNALIERLLEIDSEKRMCIHIFLFYDNVFLVSTIIPGLLTLLVICDMRTSVESTLMKVSS